MISVESNGQNEEAYNLGTQKRNSARLDGNVWQTSKDRVASRGDEKLGLSESQKEEAAILAREDDVNKKPSDYHFRSVRKKPLLMLHVLDLGREKTRVPAFGLSFPPGHYQTEIEVVANQVWIESMQSELFDTPNEEEDYDD